MGGGNVAQAVEVEDQVHGQPGVEAGVDDDAVDGGGEGGGPETDAEVVDDGAVGDGAFGRGGVVRGMHGAEESEGDVGCEDVDGEGGEHGGGADAVEGREEVEWGVVG